MSSPIDPGLVGISLRICSSAAADELVRELPFVLSQRGSMQGIGTSGAVSSGEQLSFDIDFDDGIEGAIGELLTAVNALSPQARREWDSLLDRSLDIGVTNRPERAVSRYQIHQSAVAMLGRLGMAMTVTWYWPHAACDADDGTECP